MKKTLASTSKKHTPPVASAPAAGFQFSRAQFEELSDLALTHARQLGASDAGVEVSEGAGLSVSVRKGELENVERNRDKSLGVTVYLGQRRGNASTSDFSPAAIRQTVQAAYDIARFTAEDPVAGLPDEQDVANEYPDLDLFHPWAINAEEAVGSSIGVYIVDTAAGLADALKEAFTYNDEVLVEEFIKGRELTVAVWGNEEKKEAFPIIEITTASGCYDYESKYTKGASTHIIPAPVGAEKTEEIQKLAIRTFTACGCRGVARVDMMLGEDGMPYVIEVNSVPGMTELSLVPDAGRAMGIEFPELCVRILEMAGYKK